MIEQVVFDCDGVLVDTEIVAARMVTDILAKRGVDVPVKEYIKTYTGRQLTGIYKELLTLSDQEIADLVHYTDHAIYENLVAIKGMDEVVKAIDLPKCVVSNSALQQVNKALNHIGLADAFPNRFSAEMVTKPKPAPDVYLLAAETTGFLPENCLAIEDSISGVTSAAKAGLAVIGFTGASHILPGHDKVLKKKGAIVVADSPKQLLQCINDFLKN